MPDARRGKVIDSGIIGINFKVDGGAGKGLRESGECFLAGPELPKRAAGSNLHAAAVHLNEIFEQFEANAAGRISRFGGVPFL